MITVIGSLNMDLVVTTDRAPEAGETVPGQTFSQYPGGKGANQSVAAARSGAVTAMAGRVGRDLFGDALLRALSQDPLDLSAVEQLADHPTGTATITVDRQGQNRIVVVAGANGTFKPEEMERFRPLIARSHVLLCQLEIPLGAVAKALEIAREEGVFCLVNPAPALPLPDVFYRQVDLLTPNASELELLAGMTLEDEADWREAGRILMEKGLGTLIVTLGETGCLLMDGQTVSRFPAYRVKAVDTTAAGDCFNGVLAAELDALIEEEGRGKPARRFTGATLAPAIDRAMRASAMSVTRKGAQPSLPWRHEIDDFDDWYRTHRL